MLDKDKCSHRDILKLQNMGNIELYYIFVIYGSVINIPILMYIYCRSIQVLNIHDHFKEVRTNSLIIHDLH